MFDFYALGDELRRCYFVLDADNAQMQNLRDIKSWFDSGLLTVEEYREMIHLNKRLYETYL